MIDQDPGPILYVQPDLILAESVSKDRFDTMVRDTPILSEIMDLRYNKRGNTTLHKTFPGGQLTFSGANSPASLAGRPIRAAIFDEIDRFPDSSGKEGDPILLGERRQESFHELALKFKTSTPTIRKKSRIEKEFDRSDKQYWFVKCPFCEFEQTLKWSQVRWVNRDLTHEAWYECGNDNCKAHWDDVIRVKAVNEGRWIATAPFRGIRGYHLNGIYSLMRPLKGFKNKLHQMVADFLTAKDMGKDGLKVWTNTFLAETWEDEVNAKPEWKVLHERRQPYLKLGMIPQGVRLLTAGLDFQDDRVECEIVGHGVGEETWGIRHERIYGDAKQPLIYTQIDALLNTEFLREDRAILKVTSAGFDTGHHKSQRMLYAYLRPRLGRGFYAFKGANVKNAEPISHSAKSKVETVKLIMVGTNRIKSYIYARASIKSTGPGYMNLPEEYTMEWCQQLLSEDFRTVVMAGSSFLEFYMPETILEGGTSRNEALDMRVYAIAALYARGVPNWDYLEKVNLRSIPPENDEVKPYGLMPDLPPPPVIQPASVVFADNLSLNRMKRHKGPKRNQFSGLLSGIL